MNPSCRAGSLGCSASFLVLRYWPQKLAGLAACDPESQNKHTTLDSKYIKHGVVVFPMEGNQETDENSLLVHSFQSIDLGKDKRKHVTMIKYE